MILSELFKSTSLAAHRYQRVVPFSVAKHHTCIYAHLVGFPKSTREYSIYPFTPWKGHTPIEFREIFISVGVDLDELNVGGDRSMNGVQRRHYCAEGCRLASGWPTSNYHS